MLLGKITTTVILALLFLVVILPGAPLMYLFGKDPMRHRFDESSSYRDMAKQRSVENLEKPY